MDYILQTNALNKSYGHFKALSNFNMHVPKGSIYGFVGKNGAGKTTTIGCVLNTVSKDSGTIKIFGKELADTDTELKEKIGVVYDGDNLHCTAYPAQIKILQNPGGGWAQLWRRLLYFPI